MAAVTRHDGRARHSAGWRARDPMGLVLMILGALLMASPLLAMLAISYDPGTRAAGGTSVDPGMLERAHAYDRRLLNHPTRTTGEAADPFKGSSSPAWRTDRTYLKQLGAGDLMASVSIPEIGVRMPIGHGTSSGTLEQGAGHIYGTTLPVGDKGNTVIAAHRGLGIKLLFYRVGELRRNDMIYTRAAGVTVAWKVDWKRTVNPGSKTERAMLKGDGRHTLLTLYTCDPPGLNTRRLIVRAHRVPYNPTSGTKARTDWPGTGMWTLAGTVTITAFARVYLPRVRRRIAA